MVSTKCVLSAFIAPDLKAAFHAFAQARALTKSKLLATIVADFLNNAPAVIPVSQAPDNIKSKGVFVRLTPFKHAELRRLAAIRNWHRSTYLAFLLDVHLSSKPHFDGEEIEALRRVAEQLADMGRNINQFAHALNAAPGHTHPVLAADVEAMKRLIDVERTAVKNLVQNNLKSWGVSDAK